MITEQRRATGRGADNASRSLAAPAAFQQVEDSRQIIDEPTIEQLRNERTALRMAVREMTLGAYSARFEAGLYEVLDEGAPFSDASMNHLLYSIRFQPDGTAWRTVLPREDFPEAYALREQILQLSEDIKAYEAWNHDLRYH